MKSIICSIFLFSTLVSAYTNLPQDTLKHWLTLCPSLKFVLIDVRGTADKITQVIGNEYCKPYNLAWPAPFTTGCRQIDTEQPVIVYCRSGNRSSSAASYLDSLGYTMVYNAGGIITWNGPTLPAVDTLPSLILPQPSMSSPCTGVEITILLKKNNSSTSIVPTLVLGKNQNDKLTNFFTLRGQSAPKSAGITSALYIRKTDTPDKAIFQKVF